MSETTCNFTIRLNERQADLLDAIRERSAATRNGMIRLLIEAEAKRQKIKLPDNYGQNPASVEKANGQAEQEALRSKVRELEKRLKRMERGR